MSPLAATLLSFLLCYLFVCAFALMPRRESGVCVCVVDDASEFVVAVRTSCHQAHAAPRLRSDMLGGSSLCEISHGAHVCELLDTLGFEAVAAGNHEVCAHFVFLFRRFVFFCCCFFIIIIALALMMCDLSYF